MRKEFKMSLALHWRALKILIVATILMSALPIALAVVGEAELEYYQIIIFFYSLISIPVFFLHIEYFVRNRHMRMVLEDGVLQVFHKNEKWKEISRDQILRIELVRAKNQGINQNSAIASYFYHKFLLKSGENIFITCLLNDDRFILRNCYADIPFKEKNRIICSPLIYN